VEDEVVLLVLLELVHLLLLKKHQSTENIFLFFLLDNQEAFVFTNTGIQGLYTVQ
jgi:hypothetical protein